MNKFSKKLSKKRFTENLIGINPELISKVVNSINNNEKEYILSLINELHPAHTADLLET